MSQGFLRTRRSRSHIRELHLKEHKCRNVIPIFEFRMWYKQALIFYFQGRVKRRSVHGWTWTAAGRFRAARRSCAGARRAAKAHRPAARLSIIARAPVTAGWSSGCVIPIAMCRWHSARTPFSRPSSRAGCAAAARSAKSPRTCSSTRNPRAAATRSPTTRPTTRPSTAGAPRPLRAPPGTTSIILVSMSCMASPCLPTTHNVHFIL